MGIKHVCTAGFWPACYQKSKNDPSGAFQKTEAAERKSAVAVTFAFFTEKAKIVPRNKTFKDVIATFYIFSLELRVNSQMWGKVRMVRYKPENVRKKVRFARYKVANYIFKFFSQM